MNTVNYPKIDAELSSSDFEQTRILIGRKTGHVISSDDVQSHVLIGACVTVGFFVVLAILLRILSQPCRKYLQKKYEEKTQYDKCDSSSDSSCSSSGSSGAFDLYDTASEQTGSSEFSMESSTTADILTTSKENKVPAEAMSISMTSLSSLTVDSQRYMLYNIKQVQKSKIGEIETLSTPSLLSLLTPSQASRDKMVRTTAHAYGKHLPKYYNKTEEIFKNLH